MLTNTYRRNDIDVAQPTKPYTAAYNGEGKLAAFTPTAPGITFCCFKNIDGKYYFGSMGREEKNRDPYIYRYNPVTNFIEQEKRIEAGIVAQDTHRIPTMCHDSDGHIYVCFEELKPGDFDTHGTPIRIYKTTVPFDLSTLTLLIQLPGRWSYPVIMVDGLNVFVCARGSTSPTTFIRGQLWYFNSTNGGVSFGAAVKLYDSLDENLPAYHWRLHNYQNSAGVEIIINERDNVLVNWTSISLIRGTIGSHVWTNVDGSFSKNVSTVGAITRVEKRANCLVMDSPNTATMAVNNELGIVKSDGPVKLIVSVQSLTGNTAFGNPETQLDELRFYTFSGGAWSFNNITIPANLVYYWAYERNCMYINNDQSYDDVLFIDLTNSNNVYIKRSTDNFVTETETLKLAGNGFYRLGTGAYNVSDEDDYFFVLINTIPPADSFEIENEGPEDYSNLMLLRP